MSGGIAGGIAELLGRKNQSKGVKVTIGEKQVNIDLYVVMEYGVKIPDVHGDSGEGKSGGNHDRFKRH